MSTQPSHMDVDGETGGADDPLLASLTPEQKEHIGRIIAEANAQVKEAREREQQATEREQQATEREQQAREREQQAAEREQQAAEREQQAAERARQARADAAAVRKALAEEQAERQSLEAGQTLSDYIAMEHRRHFYLPRLLPKITTTKSKAKTTSKTSTTTGRTSIARKYYPLQLRRWNDCDTVLSAAFDRLCEVVNTQQVFPSKNQMNAFEKRFLEDLPEELTNVPLYLSELRTSFFLYEVLERPTSRILNAFLTGQKIYFDNLNAGAHLQQITQDRTETSAQSEGQSVDQSSVYIGVTVQAAGQPEPVDQVNPEKQKKKRAPTKVQPDCIVLCATSSGTRADKIAVDTGEVSGSDDAEDNADDDTGDDTDDDADSNVSGEETDPKIHRVAFGEHKPAHRLRAVLLDRLVQRGIEQDYVVQMARRKATGFHKEDAKKRLDSYPGLVYYTYALAQTFHYMVSAGVVYGYLASGDTLTILHIPPNDPTTLLYRPFLFPEYAKIREAGVQPPAGDGMNAASSPIGRLCSMAVKAWEAGVMSARWRTDAFEKLALFPDLPPHLAESDTAAPSPDAPSSPGDGGGPSKREPDDGGDDEDDGGDHGRRTTGRHLTTTSTYRPRVPSPLGQHHSTTHQARQPQQQSSFFGLRKPVYLKPSQFDPSSFNPIRPYCTQACLLGLARGLPLDESCPNVFLHRRAVCHAHHGGTMTADDVLSERPGQTMHAIRNSEELGKLVVLQLYGNIVQDCQCLLSDGLYGKIGCLFKLTLTGYGYTFVAKGVEDFNRRRLRRETAVYDHLADQQGRLLPVYLGIVKLLLPYPRDDARLVSHLMLMSYGGPGMSSYALERRTRKGRDLVGVDLEHEAERTWTELEALGVADDDVENMHNNFTWCDEAQRMMRIDFHCAAVTRDSASVAVKSQVRPLQVRAAVDGRQAAIGIFATPSSRGTSHSPPLMSFKRAARQRSVDSGNSSEGHVRAAKRKRVLLE